jgi:hypothetical protein
MFIHERMPKLLVMSASAATQGYQQNINRQVVLH